MARCHVAKVSMRVLRIYCRLTEPPLQCQWIAGDDVHMVEGEGRLEELPRNADRIQLVIAAADVVLLKVRLPKMAHRQPGTVLAFAVEEQIIGDPDANEVIWLGSTGEEDAIAVINRQHLTRWRDALAAAGVNAYDIVTETLLLPRRQGEWSLSWNGRDGFLRCGEFEGAATDWVDHNLPPLSLCLMIEQARMTDSAPKIISVYWNSPEMLNASVETAIDWESWERNLGVNIRVAGPWNWRTLPLKAGMILMKQHRRWQISPVFFKHLRPAAWMAAAALAIHAIASLTDWTRHVGEERALRAQMEARFRTAVPDAVAVVDPALQMRRKLAEARHTAGLPDSDDFLPMIEMVGAALRALPPGSVRLLSYENGRMTLRLLAAEAAVRSSAALLGEAGLVIDVSSDAAKGGEDMMVLTVRSI